MDNIITLVLICAGVSLLLNVLLKKFHVESVIGYILTGMAVGFAFDLQHSDSLEVIAEFGIVFLMFTIGLEFSPEKLRLMKKEVFVYGPLQMAITASIFFAIGHWVLGIAPTVNLIVSLALSLSSTAIVLNLLTKSRKISRRYGRNSVGVLLFQDIAVIPILLMVSIFSSSQDSISQLMLDVVMDGGIVFLLLFLGGRIMTPHVMEHVIGTRSNELFVGAILLFVVGAAQLAHGLGFSYSLGAFLAGMVLSETQYKHQVEADLTPFRDLLLGVFFITVGMQVNPLFVVANLPMILLVMVTLLAVKSLVLFAFLRFFNGTHTSLKTALLLAQSGEFSFVVFETAQANNLFMDPELGQVLVMAIVLTMMLTPFVFQYLDRITQMLAREPEQKAGHSVDEIEEEVDEQHVVICGYGVLGQRIGAQLDEAGVPFVGVEHDGTSFRASKEKGAPVYFGNAGNRQFLEKIKIDHARAVVIAMSNEPRILLVAQSVRSVAPDVPIMVCATNRQLKEELDAVGVSEPIDSLDQTADALARQVIELELVQESGG
ncbi:cation:proton antiporter [Motiliproteus sediminis]|uniref:cation:proton antiporter n=1 Tax=Motiliproteus sediminis TaxID=1468178 RepID=UPI001AEF88EB|nr:cation:proton antiporter [Motiliproteus sediminis]